MIGVGISNRPLIDFLLCHDVRVTVRDIKTRDELRPLADELENKGVRLVLGKDYLCGLCEDIIFKSPGIRGDLSELVAAKNRGSEITSEMETFVSLCPCRIFAVTGSDGKTTSTTLAYLMLSRELEARGSRSRVHVGGNIGKPLLPEIESINPDDFVVLELSSFQLNDMTRSPYSAAITNISPNHLNWHTDMNEYIRAKENIFLHDGNERLVLNYGCETTRDMYSLSKAEITYFSAHTKPSLDHASAAIYLSGDDIVFKTRQSSETIMSRADIKLPGIHNVENYMTSIALTRGYVSNDTIRTLAREFGGVEHRCEFVREFDGVKYYNSSIDSSPTRTEAALRSFTQPLIVICGGYDKHIPYAPLAKPLIDCAKKVVLVGATAPKIKAALTSCPEYTGSPEIIEADSFEGAVMSARGAASQGDIVILSPASASFDMFKNFEERGNRFKEIVNSFK